MDFERRALQTKTQQIEAKTFGFCVWIVVIGQFYLPAAHISAHSFRPLKDIPKEKEKYKQIPEPKTDFITLWNICVNSCAKREIKPKVRTNLAKKKSKTNRWSDKMTIRDLQFGSLVAAFFLLLRIQCVSKLYLFFLFLSSFSSPIILLTTVILTLMYFIKLFASSNEWRCSWNLEKSTYQLYLCVTCAKKSKIENPIDVDQVGPFKLFSRIST